MYLAKSLRQGRPLEEVFAQYEHDRRPCVEKIIRQARRNGNSKKTRYAFTSWLRNQVMAIVIPLFIQKRNDWVFRYQIHWDEKATTR